jgi:hypothetical protein
MTKEELKTNPIEPELLNLLYVFLKDIGLNKEVEAVNKNKVKTKTRKVFHQLVTDNPYFPNNADVDLMLRAFFKDCIYGGVEIKGRSIKALVGAFRDFSIKPHLQNAFRVNRELPPKTERTIEEWTDQEIRKAVENVERLGLGWNDTNFYQRIKQQANLRGIL